MLDPHPLQLPNQCMPTPDLVTCGLPSAADLRAAQASGIRTIINLCQPHETGAEEPALVRELGMQYFQIPVSGAADLTEAKAQELAAALNDCNRHPALIHCMSGNRVGALLALKGFFADGMTPETALRLGLSAGLKALEPVVRDILSRHHR